MNRISLDKFIDKYVGKNVGVPWGYAGECVSLVQRYINECHNQPLKRRGDAIVYGDRLIRDGVGKVVTTPKKGDIIVWGKPLGLINGKYYGHVAIYMNSGAIFDQNNYSVKPTRTAQVRPMIKTAPIQYIRMNTALVEDKPKYQEEVYAFTSTVDLINTRADYSTKAKIVGGLKKGETFNYIGKIEANGYVWVTDGAEWLAVREVKNGIRGKLWGTLQPQKDKPKPVTPKKEYVQLGKNVRQWGIYKLGVQPIKKNIFAYLKPANFGGLEYEILGRPFADTVTINTRDHGKVNIWIGKGTAHRIVKK